MTSPPSAFTALVSAPQKMRSVVGAAVTLGIILCFAGVGIGIAVGLHRRRITCPNGTVIPEGQNNFHCYSYAHAGVGSFFVVLSLATGVLISLVGLVALTLAVGPRPGDRDEANKVLT